jgi:hypothetical protein
VVEETAVVTTARRSPRRYNQRNAVRSSFALLTRSMNVSKT